VVSLQQNNGAEDLKRKTVHFSLNVPASTQGALTYRIPGECTIERVSLRFYPDAMLNLQLDPYLLKTKERRYNLIDYVTGAKGYIDGDDDYFIYTCKHPAQVDDVLTIEYNNIDAVDAFDFTVDIELDFMGGLLRSEVVR